MGKIGQNKQRHVTGYPMVWFSVCAGSFVRTVRMHTNLDIVLMNKEAAP